jgi:hypothetical protein
LKRLDRKPQQQYGRRDRKSLKKFERKHREVWSSGETLVIINSMNESEARTCKIELHRNSEQKKTTKPCKTKTAKNTKNFGDSKQI